MSFLLSIIGMLTGLVNPVGRIVGQIADAREKAALAETNSERIAADERIAALQAQRDVLIAESGSSLNAAIRAMFALPFAIYITKVVLVDKVLGRGVTDPLSPWLADVCMIVVGFYFVREAAVAAARALRR